MKRTIIEWECLNCHKVERQRVELGNTGYLPLGWLEIYDSLHRMHLCSWECAIEVLQGWIDTRPMGG
jgi:hypothetical protein